MNLGHFNSLQFKANVGLPAFTLLVFQFNFELRHRVGRFAQYRFRFFGRIRHFRYFRFEPVFDVQKFPDSVLNIEDDFRFRQTESSVVPNQKYFFFEFRRFSGDPRGHRLELEVPLLADVGQKLPLLREVRELQLDLDLVRI